MASFGEASTPHDPELSDLTHALRGFEQIIEMGIEAINTEQAFQERLAKRGPILVAPKGWLFELHATRPEDPMMGRLAVHGWDARTQQAEAERRWLTDDFLGKTIMVGDDKRTRLISALKPHNPRGVCVVIDPNYHFITPVRDLPGEPQYR